MTNSQPGANPPPGLEAGPERWASTHRTVTAPVSDSDTRGGHTNVGQDGPDKRASQPNGSTSERWPGNIEPHHHVSPTRPLLTNRLPANFAGSTLSDREAPAAASAQLSAGNTKGKVVL
ncbi:hypothetical protein [Natronoglycomyces albus]|uniref:Uncharacterized protein n=1 Tax=Natronoglycomyces albus TaxID=2811108 RepID=A0A895XNT3_9ACTN|nr:hypothetical protein [Natronoglycomyces albus]QSB04156.1 hypothetical protein JQS30_10060 [Natronoglycomyces albus]